MTEGRFAVQRFGAEETGSVAGELATLYRAVYGAHEPAASDPFHSRERFLERLDRYRAGADFTLLVARGAGTMVGFAYGYALQPEARWWATVQPPISADIAGRTRAGRFFALNDIAVHPAYRRRGIAEALHRRLLATQAGRSITLLVEPDNAPAAAAYAKWGYRFIGTQQPFADSPVYRTMVLDRPATPTKAGRGRASAAAPSRRIGEMPSEGLRRGS